MNRDGPEQSDLDPSVNNPKIDTTETETKTEANHHHHHQDPHNEGSASQEIVTVTEEELNYVVTEIDPTVLAGGINENNNELYLDLVVELGSDPTEYDIPQLDEAQQFVNDKDYDPNRSISISNQANASPHQNVKTPSVLDSYVDTDPNLAGDAEADVDADAEAEAENFYNSDESNSSYDSHSEISLDSESETFRKLRNEAFIEEDVTQETETEMSEPISIVNWLNKQKLNNIKANNNNNIPTNLIMLDPDLTTDCNNPAVDSIAITPLHPITCKLCCKKLNSELEVKIHVQYCWLENKSNHRYCVPCQKTFDKPSLLRLHSKRMSHMKTTTATPKANSKKRKISPKELQSNRKHHIRSVHDEGTTHSSKTKRARKSPCET